MAVNSLTEKLLVKEDHLPMTKTEDRALNLVTKNDERYLGLLISTIGIVGYGTFFLKFLLKYHGIPASAWLQAYLRLGIAAITASSLAMVLCFSRITPRFAKFLRILNLFLLSCMGLVLTGNLLLLHEYALFSIITGTLLFCVHGCSAKTSFHS